jgi:hypothetical protein
LQEAFGALTMGMTPQDRLDFGKGVFQKVPQNHEFKRNTLVGDHQDGDAGFYDLLLHSQDVSCTVKDVVGHLEHAGLALQNFTQPAMYSLDGILPQGFKRSKNIGHVEEMQLAEKLRGNMKTHVGYAVKAGASVKIDSTDPAGIPHFIGEDPKKAAAFILQKGGLPVAINGQKIGIGISPQAAKLLGLIDGQSNVGVLQKKSGLGAEAFNAAWKKLSDLLCGYGLMLYSGLNED